MRLYNFPFQQGDQRADGGEWKLAAWAFELRLPARIIGALANSNAANVDIEKQFFIYKFPFYGAVRPSLIPGMRSS